MSARDSLAVPVLTYHGLHAPGWDYHENDHVALAQDLEQLAGLGYKVIPLSTLVAHLFATPKAPAPESKLVAISFDDGSSLDYLDFYHPDYGHLKSFNRILGEHGGLGWDGGAPVGTSFVIASPGARLALDRACIAGRGQWGDEWWRQAAEQGQLEIANHSWDHTHVELEQLAVDERHRGSFAGIDEFEAADLEIMQAQRYIGEKTGGASAPLFAYPYGEFNDFLAGEYFPARGDHFQAAFTTSGAPATAASNRWLVPRYVCGEHWSSPEGLREILDAT